MANKSEDVAHQRQLLLHWQTWEEEYEALLGELPTLKSGGRQALDELAEDVGGTLVTTSEIKKIVQDDKGNVRPVSQIKGLVSRRLDYVRDNVAAAKKRLKNAEALLNPPSRIVDIEGGDREQVSMDLEADEALPIREIFEQLDDDDNVVSSSVTAPAKTAAHLAETLKKTGMMEPSNEGVTESRSIKPLEPDHPTTAQNGSREFSVEANSPTSSKAIAAQSSPGNETAQAKNHATGPVKIQAGRSSSLNEKSSTSELTPATELRQTPSKAHNVPNAKAEASPKKSSDDVSKVLQQTPLAQASSSGTLRSKSDLEALEEESEAEKTLRRDMLAYNAGKDGPVVAEMTVGDESFESDEDFDEDESEDDNDDDDDEDKWGRSTRSFISDEYRQRMIELEQKLNPRGTSAASASPGQNKSRQNTVTKTSKDLQGGPSKSKKEMNGAKKAVRFAGELDVSPNTSLQEKSTPQPVKPSEARSQPPPMVEEVQERQFSNANRSTEPPKKVSRFKASRSATNPVSNTSARKIPPSTRASALGDSAESSQSPHPLSRESGLTAKKVTSFEDDPSEEDHPPQEDENEDEDEDEEKEGEREASWIHANKVIERPFNPEAREVAEPDEFDPAIMQQELMAEYNRMRNRAIQREGGFLKVDPDEEVLGPLYDAKGRKVSKFRAARMSGSGL